MNESDESWDSVSAYEIKLTKAQEKTRTSHQMTKMKILHQCLYIIESLRYVREFVISDGVNVYEKLNQIQNNSMKLRRGIFEGMFHKIEHKSSEKSSFEILKNELMTLFISLNKNGIPCRIYFVLNKDISCFVEYVLNQNIIKHPEKVNGLCFSIDFNGFISDQTINFSKNCSHHHFFSKVISSIQKNFLKTENSPVEVFSVLDSQRLKLIPHNISKIKIHPLYITEECCKFNETIYPKRPVFGYFKGNSVYSRKNVVKLRTENGWYNQGRKLKEQSIPYRIYKAKKLFAEFQTEDIEINKIEKPVIDVFHPNHIPKNCIHINYCSEIVKMLGIEYAETVIGFKGNTRIVSGFVVEKKYCYALNCLIKEKEYYEKIFDKLDRYKKCLKEWNKLCNKMMKLIEIRKRIGM